VTEVQRSLIVAVLLSLVIIPARLEAGAAETSGPSRIGLALERAAVEVLPAAVEAATDELEEIARFNHPGQTMRKNGFQRELARTREVRLTGADLGRPTPFELAGGTVTRVEREGVARLVWTGEVRVAGAAGQRLHLGGVALPAGSRAWVYGADGTARAVSPRLIARGGSLWSGTVHGERAWLEVEVPIPALGPGSEARFALDRVLEVVALDDDGRPRTGLDFETKDHCLVDAACVENEFGELTKHHRRAVARIVFVRPDGGFLCSGGLLADAEPLQVSQRGFFLTARHCFSTQEAAESVEALFHYRSRSCDGPVDFEVVAGADLLASVEASDSTLIELHELPSNPHFLPWNPSPGAFANGDLLHMLSHPHGRPQHFTQVVADPGCVNDASVFSTVPMVGIATGGSSGAPLLNAAGEVVAQLGGGCAGPGPEDSCDPGYFLYFGRLSRSYQAFGPFLEAPPPPPEAEYFTDPAYPDWKFRVVISAAGSATLGVREDACLPETVCVSGALPGRSEVFLRIVGPRPNGKLWPTLVKFTTSQVDVWVRQLSTGEEKHYTLAGAAPGVDELPGLFDRNGFDP
jgi:hypothetical protein